MRSVSVVKSKGELGEGLIYNVEGLKRIGNILILHGWVVDPLQRLCLFSVSHPARKSHIDVRPRMIRFDRPDVRSAFNAPMATTATHYGFVAVLTEIQATDQLTSLGVAVVSSSGRLHVEGVGVTVMDRHVHSVSALAGILAQDGLTAEQCEKLYEPVFREILKQTGEPVQKFDVEFGQSTASTAGAARTARTAENSPSFSMIIPLYGPTRFELTQIPALAALMKNDFEIIFAVDDPMIADEVRANVERLSSLYGIKTRVLAVASNLGFSGINNFAAEKARGKYVLFLNSDCFIARYEPIKKAIDWLKENPTAGAVGFRLMYADRTVQHDGMSVAMWNSNDRFMLNNHPRMGLPADTAVQQEDDPAVMLTAACLLMERQLFLSVGGFDRAYLRGDFEDSDLCLKLISKRLRLGIVRDESIFHLERQTISAQEPGIRQKITLVNSYIYSKKWRELLAKPLQPLEVIQ